MVSKYIVRVNNGITEVSRPTSSTVIVRIPYSMLNKELHTKNSFIVYILFGHSTKGKDKIYVGKSKNGIDYRPTSHEDKYDSWEYCYVLTQHKENTFFNDGIIQYIENQISNHVNDIGRFENTTVTTTDSTVNEYEKDDCEAYIDDAYNMLYAIGLDLITPANEEDNIVVETTKEPEVAPVVEQKADTFELKVPQEFYDRATELKKTKDLVPVCYKRLEFWFLFNEVLKHRGYPFKACKPSTNHWYNVNIGSSRCYLGIHLLDKNNRIRIKLLMRDDKQLYKELYQYKNDIESELGREIIWDNRANVYESSLSYYMAEGKFSYKDKSNYYQIMNEIIDNVIQFRTVIKKYVKY